LIEESRKLLGVVGEGVTEDGLFSIDAVRCVGCCGLAPVMTIGHETYGKLTKDRLPDIFAKYKGQ